VLARKLPHLLLLLLLLAPGVHAEKILYETDWIADQEMSPVLQKMNKNYLFPCRIEGRSSGAGKIFKASYCAFLPRLRYFYSRWGMSASDYERYSAYYAKQKMTPHFHTTFDDEAGSTWHQVTWVLMNEEPREPAVSAKRRPRAATTR
jgi:hypothetical protein